MDPEHETKEVLIDVRPQISSTAENSTSWKLWHGLNYLNGGVTFLIGSFCYYTKFNTVENNFLGYFIGSILFTVGSFSFLLSDLTEWFHFRKGCTYDTEYGEEKTWKRTFLRASLGINFFISVIGSLLYLIGSICFIPQLNQLYLGEQTFIIGSLVIFFSQVWKCLRTAFTNDRSPKVEFQISNITEEDFLGFLVDAAVVFGSLFYAIGTYYFEFAITDVQINVSSTLFVLGGIGFLSSGVFMQYRYFFDRKSKAYQVLPQH